jgi:hypothetical protein
LAFVEDRPVLKPQNQMIPMRWRTQEGSLMEMVVNGFVPVDDRVLFYDIHGGSGSAEVAVFAGGIVAGAVVDGVVEATTGLSMGSHVARYLTQRPSGSYRSTSVGGSPLRDRRVRAGSSVSRRSSSRRSRRRRR